MMVEASSTCNLRCPLCLWTHNDRHGQLAPATFARFINEARTFLRRICFAGRGEPTLNPRVYEILRLCADAGVIADLATNGTRLAHNVDRILDCGVDNVNVSIEADNAADYARYRVRGDFDEVVEGMRRLAEAKHRRRLRKPNLQTVSVIFGFNEDALERMKAFFRELGFENFTFKSAHLGHGQLSEDMTTLQQQWLPRDPGRRRAIFNDREHVECSFLPKAQLLWNGDITRCAVHQNQMIIGNVLESSFRDIWRGPRSRAAVATIVEGRFAACQSCEFSGRHVEETAHERYVV